MQKREVTMRDWIFQTFSGPKYHGTTLRRIPQHIVEKMERSLITQEILRERAEANRHLLRPGAKVLLCAGPGLCGLSVSTWFVRCVQVQCRYNDGKLYDAVVDEVLSSGTYVVTYTEYNEQAEVSPLPFPLPLLPPLTRGVRVSTRS
jgi:hypothetical protein